MNNKEFRQKLVLACIQGAMACNQGDEIMGNKAVSEYALRIALEVSTQMENNPAFRDLLQNDQ